MMEIVSKYFRLNEFVYSRTAILRGIDNMPPPEVIERIELLTRELLDPLRELYGKPIHITSGYRCEEVNRRVGGSPFSQHLSGEAADIYVARPVKLRSLLLGKGLPFDQAIWYPARNFFHLSYKGNGENRRLYIEMD